MKKIINGKTYNTETATWLDGLNINSRDSWNNVSECLYVTKNGSFFLCGYGDSNTRWAVKSGPYKDKRGTLTSDIQALTKKEAFAWCKENSDPETIEEHFSKIVEET
tara:strand:+ start:2562 stop:2882 length:321 start_codon:yes stop_codon:yes gene_type:complete